MEKKSKSALPTDRCMMDADVPVMASVMIRTRRALGSGEGGLAISGSHAVFGAWDARKYKCATYLGDDWWTVHVYVPRDTKIWWKWLILAKNGEEMGRERCTERCLAVAGDSLLITAEWNRPTEVHRLWPEEQKEVATREMDPGFCDTGQHSMHMRQVDWGPAICHAPPIQWDVLAPSLNNSCPSYVSRYRPTPADWPDNEKPTEGLGSDLHDRQMAAAVAKEMKAETDRCRLNIDYQLAKWQNILEERKMLTVNKIMRLASGAAFVAESFCFGNDQKFVQNICLAFRVW